MPNDNGLPEKVKLTKADIDKMIEQIKTLEGKEVLKGKPIHIDSGTTAWYVAYGT